MVIKKSKTPSFILTLPLAPEPWQIDKFNKDFKVACKIYNSLKTKTVNRYNQMIKTKSYRYWINQLKNSQKDGVQYQQAQVELQLLRKKFCLSEFDFHNDVKPFQHYYSKNINSAVAQKLASSLWTSFSKVIFDKGKYIHYKSQNQFTSIEGKNNSTGIVFKDGFIKYGGTKIKVDIHKNDNYIQQALKNRVKFCRICRAYIRGRWKYTVQLVLEGTPPIKVTDSGELKHPMSTGNVGLDIGPQTVAIVSNQSICLIELADKTQKIENQLNCINRAMDRSRRATNPNRFNENGTIKHITKKERYKWNNSNHYIKLMGIRRELYRKQAVVRKQQHIELANKILSLGNKVYIENMNFSALSKRSKETKKSDKTGKFISKKRFGKSISNKAPAMFVSILEQKLKNVNGVLYKIDTSSVKASQYNHDTKTYEKYKLSDRTKIIQNHTIQRDLYSAFLIKNVNPDLKSINQKQCEQDFNQFVILHEKEINRLKQKNHTLMSMGINKF